MGGIIHLYKMPESCSKCIFSNEEVTFCRLRNSVIIAGKTRDCRMPLCPIKSEGEYLTRMEHSIRRHVKKNEKFKVEPCVYDYAVKDNKGEIVVFCNSKQNADLIAAILEKDSYYDDGWSEVESDYTFMDNDYYKVISQYSTRMVYGIKEVRQNNGEPCRNIVPGVIVRHFMGNLYEVKDIVKHAETDEMMVVYQALYPNKNGQRQTYIRPLPIFMEEVDHKKYPYVRQQYCLEIVQFKDVREGE